MKFDMDYIAHNNALTETNPYFKLFLTIILLIVTLALDNLYFDIIIFIVMSIVILAIAKIAFKSYLKFLSIPMSFLVITCIFLIFFFGSGEVIYDTKILGIVVTKNSLHYGVYTFMRVMACLPCLGFLALTTPIAKILHCLATLKVPKIIIEIGLLMYNIKVKLYSIPLIQEVIMVNCQFTSQKTGVIKMLEVQNLKYSYNNDYQALKGVSLKIDEGEMIALLGKNGAGKSTLFLHLNGIYEPDEGKVLIDGEELKYDKKSLLKFRQKVGIVFQNPDDQIFAPTVEEDVAFGPLNLGLSMEEVQDRVEEALARVGMSGTEKIAPHHLSGGQKKRVAIAGILAMKPEIMILDEPTAGLDPQGVENLVKLLKELNDEGITILISTHEVDLVPDYANKVFVLVDGELIAEGTPKAIFSQPEVLEKAHLKIPIVTELFQQLETEGFDMENDYPLTIEEAKEKFLTLINKN